MKLSETERKALAKFAKQHGRRWKSALRTVWMNGCSSPVLQHLRNDPDFGPYGLTKVRPADLLQMALTGE